MLLESEAEAGRDEKKAELWSAALRHWEELAQKLARMRPRPLSYFDAWYHAAYALFQQNQPTKAPRSLTE